MTTRMMQSGSGAVIALCTALAFVGLVGCDQAGEGNSLGDAPPASASGEMPSTVGPDGTLVTDAADAAGSLTVMSVGGPGDFVADNSRRAVYMLKGDEDGEKCTVSCRTQWAPLFPPTGEATVSGTLAPVLLGAIERADGSQQITYNDHPLYHFIGDTRPGDTLGHERHDEWGDWYLLNPQGGALGEEVGELEGAGDPDEEVEELEEAGELDKDADELEESPDSN